MIIFLKAHVGPYLRQGKLVNLHGYEGRAARAPAPDTQLALFPVAPRGETQAEREARAGGAVAMPRDELVREHKRLVAVLRSPSHADDKVEAEKQAAELREYERREVHGLPVRIENPRGSIRSKTPRHGGAPWQITMQHDYGDIEGTRGADGDPIDVYVGPDPTSDRVFVVNQSDKEGRFNEHKVLMGFDSAAAARAGYLAHYPAGWNGIGSMAEMSVPEFKAWLANGDKAKPAATDPRKRYYVTVIRDPGPRQRVGYLAGPFADHDEAKDHVDRARALAGELDPATAFDYFGTTGVTADKHRSGVLNGHLGLPS